MINSVSYLASRGLLDSLSSSGAMAGYMIVLMALVAILTVYVMKALQLIRKGEPRAAEPGKKEKEASQGRFAGLSRIDREQKKPEAQAHKAKTILS